MTLRSILKRNWSVYRGHLSFLRSCACLNTESHWVAESGTPQVGHGVASLHRRCHGRTFVTLFLVFRQLTADWHCSCGTSQEVLFGRRSQAMWHRIPMKTAPSNDFRSIIRLFRQLAEFVWNDRKQWKCEIARGTCWVYLSKGTIH